MLGGKKILLGVTGSIAAYKSASLVRLLVKAGAEVKVVMTRSSQDFINPLTLSTLSRNPALTDLFSEGTWSNHVMLGRWADLMLIAPLSCNTLGKMASGLCDNMLLATWLSATCPVAVAPAMDEDMWKHPVTRSNLDKLREMGITIIPVNHGELASGLVGEGRMAEPEDMLPFLEDRFFTHQDLAGKKVLVTAGPTHEPIDPVRFIGNHSSGKMGIALCRELARRGAAVKLVLGPVAHPNDLPPGIELVNVQTAEEMYTACMEAFPGTDVAILSAAVADYTPLRRSPEKIKKDAGTLNVELTRTRDILKTLGENKGKGQLLVGFALETENEKTHAAAKLRSKHADLIVLNSLRDKGAGFGYDTNKVTLFGKNGTETEYDLKPKQQVAKDIVDSIVKMLYG